MLIKSKITLITASILWSIIFCTPVQAQFVDNNADFYTVDYDDKGKETNLYAFYAPKTGILKAKSPSNAAADFEWYRFDQTTRTLIPTPIKTELNVTTSEVNGLPEDGYLLKITQGVVIDTFRAWVFLDTLAINNIQNENTCGFLRLTAQAQYRTNYFWYNFIDLDNPRLRLYPNSFNLRWEADNDIRAGVQASNAWQNVSKSLSTVIDNPAPLTDAIYKVSITNGFNNTATAQTAFIPYMAVYPKFEILRPDENGIYRSTTDLKGEALYKVKFQNKSINANQFTWEGYGNQLINFERDKIKWTETTENIDTEKEYLPGNYPVVLTVKNISTGCLAATLLKGTILEVEPSKLDPASVPNAFSPNGDGQNDYFTFVKGLEPVSLVYVDIKIFNRNGTLVYKYNGAVSSWTGWNGKHMGSGGECGAGVYYYVINGRGWDDISYSDKNLTGAVHLFR